MPNQYRKNISFDTMLNRKSGTLVFLSILIVVSLCACSQSRPKPYEAQIVAFGTLVNITIWGAGPELSTQATSGISKEFNALHRHWHAWQSGRLMDINKSLQTSKDIKLDSDEAYLLGEAIQLSRASGHLFNPAIGRLVSLWGFHSDDRPSAPVPSRNDIQQLLDDMPDVDDLRLTNNLLSSTNPLLALDLGGIAKGYAVDKGIEVVKELGISNAIINAGGDLRAIGNRGDRPWRVGIRDPRGDGIIASIEINKDESVFTSGDYERYFDYNGHRYHHIIDPRTGYPGTDTQSVTVIDTSATRADAAATALFIAGPDEWVITAKSMGIKQVMLINKNGTIYLSPAMAKRVMFDHKNPSIIVSEPL